MAADPAARLVSLASMTPSWMPGTISTPRNTRMWEAVLVYSICGSITSLPWGVSTLDSGGTAASCGRRSSGGASPTGCCGAAAIWVGGAEDGAVGGGMAVTDCSGPGALLA